MKHFKKKKVTRLSCKFCHNSFLTAIMNNLRSLGGSLIDLRKVHFVKKNRIYTLFRNSISYSKRLRTIFVQKIESEFVSRFYYISGCVSDDNERSMIDDKSRCTILRLRRTTSPYYLTSHSLLFHILHYFHIDATFLSYLSYARARKSLFTRTGKVS